MSVTASEIILKQPSEKRLYSMDFSNLMATGEGISSIDSISSETRGGDVSTLVFSNQAISSQTVLVWISGGTSCFTYRVEILVTTTLGQKLEGDGMLKVEDK